MISLKQWWHKWWRERSRKMMLLLPGPLGPLDLDEVNARIRMYQKHAERSQIRTHGV